MCPPTNDSRSIGGDAQAADDSTLGNVGRGPAPGGLRFNLMRGFATIEPRVAESLFYADCADPAVLAARLQPQPFRTFLARTRLPRAG